MSPEAAVGGPIALVEEGDLIRVNIPELKLELDVSEEELNVRKAKMAAQGAQCEDRMILQDMPPW